MKWRGVEGHNQKVKGNNLTIAFKVYNLKDLGSLGPEIWIGEKGRETQCIYEIQVIIPRHFYSTEIGCNYQYHKKLWVMDQKAKFT